MKVVQTDTFLMFRRNLLKKEKKQLNEEIRRICEQPDLGKETSDELEGILIYDYTDEFGKKRLCYSLYDTTLTLHLITKISIFV